MHILIYARRMASTSIPPHDLAMMQHRFIAHFCRHLRIPPSFRHETALPRVLAAQRRVAAYLYYYKIGDQTPTVTYRPVGKQDHEFLESLR